ncbi:MAG: UvrB/UvrC motif-containing protein [Candidatus Latescibacterota bacterium]|nr:UvrB/UvrC motif-containing protein [Candidatus Latescibacterota bacterium]
MICQNCNEEEASVVITKLVGEQHSISHLCKDCSNSLGGPSGVAISIQTLTSESSSMENCKTCGKSFSDFRKSGLFGCSDCYTHFDEHLTKLFKRVQGVRKHVSESTDVPLDDPVSLKSKLKEAVVNEDFERAALLRDRLAALGAESSPP